MMRVHSYVNIYIRISMQRCMFESPEITLRATINFVSELDK